MFVITNYVRAQSLGEAWELNQKKNSRVIGGMIWMKMGDYRVQTAIDLSDLGLDRIEETEEEFRIGCMVTLRDLETHKGFADYTKGAVKEALRHIVGVQLRNLATVGGSIWGRFGFSDVLSLFLSMDSYVELYHGGIVTLEEFAGRRPDRDILVRVIVKKTKGQFCYLSVRNSQTDFPVLTCGASCMEREGGGQTAVCIGARPGRAVRIVDKEGILERGITPERAKAFAGYVRKQVKTGSNMRGSAEYRSHLAEVLTERAVQRLGGESGC